MSKSFMIFLVLSTHLFATEGYRRCVETYSDYVGPVFEALIKCPHDASKGFARAFKAHVTNELTDGSGYGTAKWAMENIPHHASVPFGIVFEAHRNYYQRNSTTKKGSASWVIKNIPQDISVGFARVFRAHRKNNGSGSWVIKNTSIDLSSDKGKCFKRYRNDGYTGKESKEIRF